MISQLIITFLGWLALVLVGINLIGMLIHGLVLTSGMDKLVSEGSDAFKKLAGEVYDKKAERKTNVIALILVIVYLAALYYFWNIGVVIAAAMIMVARIPDLLWEKEHGRQSIPRMPARYAFTLLIMIVALPVLWYALYQL